MKSARDNIRSGARSNWLVRRLARQTTSGRFIPEIDGLRFLSIALVVLFHASGFLVTKTPYSYEVQASATPVARLLSVGHNGVQLFFVISGFVLALPFAGHWLLGRKSVSLKAYLLRRLTRLEPPYIIAMAALWVVYSGVKSVPLGTYFPNLAASLGYSHNVIYGRPNVFNVVAWSLEIEVQFYLLVPLLTLVFALKRDAWRRCAIVGLALVAIGAQSLFAGSPRLQLSLLNQLQYFLIGFLLADLYLVAWRESPRKTIIWDVVGLIALPILFLLWARAPESTSLIAAFSFLTFCSVFRGKYASRIFSNAWLTTIGGMCYTIYLLHYPLISFVGNRTITMGGGASYGMHLAVQLAVMLPVLLLASTAFFLLVEQPCMDKDWPRKAVMRGRQLRERTVDFFALPGSTPR